jgi:hypothetical protein
MLMPLGSDDHSYLNEALLAKKKSGQSRSSLEDALGTSAPTVLQTLESDNTTSPSLDSRNIQAFRERNIQFMRSLVGLILSIALFTLFAESGLKDFTDRSLDTLMIGSLALSAITLISACFYGFKVMKINDSLQKEKFSAYKQMSQEFRNALLGIVGMTALTIIFGELGGGFHHFNISNGFHRGALTCAAIGGLIFLRALKVAYDWNKPDDKIIKLIRSEENVKTQKASRLFGGL